MTEVEVVINSALVAILIAGPVFALRGGLRDGAWPGLLFTQLALLLLRWRPMRFMSLLETARERQVLRQAGAVYQFRHADLQDRLTDRYRQEHLDGGASAGWPHP
jgi:hypothetical protein